MNSGAPGEPAASLETIPASSPAHENAAWAVAQIPLPPRQLFEFLAGIERLFRLNPYLEIADWQSNSDTSSYRLRVLNEMNGFRGDISFHVEAIHADSRWGANSGYRLVYDSGLKQSTELVIKAEDGGSRLTITERYQPVQDESDERLKEVDRSLVPWAAALRNHLRDMARFSALPGYRWWKERFMLGISPRQRRIVRLIVWISVLEFVVFLFVAAIFWLEARAPT